MDILFKDRDWLVINKPTGLSTHGAWEGDLGVEEWLALHRGEKTYVCSRLDKGTSGVLVLARTKSASARAQAIHASEQARKTYVFLSHADSEAMSGKRAWVREDPIDGHPARTVFERERRVGSNVLYRAEITRGRMHQIRRHAAASAVPILGDGDYGGKTFPRLALHCHEILWPEIDAPLHADLPASFNPNNAGGLLAKDPTFAVSFDRRLAFYEGMTTAFRVVHRREIRTLDCAIDYYGRFLCAWVYEGGAPMESVMEQLHPYLGVLLSHYKAKGAIVKRANRDPHHRTLVGETRIVGTPPPPDLTVVEHGLSFQVTLGGAHHAGLFLDQRDNRRRVARLAHGKRVANLFAYTCSFSAVAAHAGAEVVFSIESAKSALEMGKVNFELNHLTASGRGKFVETDVRAWLAKECRKRSDGGQGYDLIICDPPTFSSTKSLGTFAVETAWEGLARDCRRLLCDGGVAFFSTNHRGETRDYYFDRLKRHFSAVTPLSPPLDFPSLPGEPEHVKLFRCAV